MNAEQFDVAARTVVGYFAGHENAEVSEAADDLIRHAEELERENAKLLEANKAAVQCVTDFLECYKNDCARIVMDEAAKSLKTDALSLLHAAAKGYEATPC